MKPEFRVSDDMRSTDKLKAALSYIKELGVSVVLTHGIGSDGKCTCGAATCASPGKHPIIKFFPAGVHSATTDRVRVRAALKEFPDANIAIALKGFTAIDVDGAEGEKTLRDAGLPETATSFSGRGYRQLYRGEFASGTVKTKQLDILSGPDRYLIMPPSRHASGVTYEWDRKPLYIALLSDAVVRFAESLLPRKPVSRDTAVSEANIKEGARNSFLTRFAGLLRYAGLAANHLPAVLSAINEGACKPPLDEKEVAAVAESVGRYGSTYEDAFVTLADVPEEKIEWLIKPFLLKGALAVLDGDPGQGKSYFCAAIAAAISVGKRLPFSQEAVQGDVLLMAAEDRNATVQVPRLRLNGADLNRIHAQEAPFTLDVKGLALLRAALEKYRPILVIIDPITAYMGSDVDFHRVNDTTEFLVAVEALAREFNCAILIVRHLNKSSGNNALYRGIGSIAVSARVRSGWILGRHPDDHEVRAVAHSKPSYGRSGPTILFELKEFKGVDHAQVIWRGTTTELDADSILARPPSDRGRPNDEREGAKRFLRETLAEGPIEKERVARMAEARSISLMTLRRAADDLNIIKSKAGKRSVWALPESEKKSEEE